MKMYYAQREFISKVSALKAALVISVDRLNAVGSGSGQGRLIDPESRRAMMDESSNVPLITVHDQKVVNLYDALKAGAAPIDATLKLPAPVEKPVKVRNVIGILARLRPYPQRHLYSGDGALRPFRQKRTKCGRRQYFQRRE